MKSLRAWVLGAIACWCPVVLAAPPVLESLYPLGGQRGTKMQVAAAGKVEPWPVKAWTDSPGIVFEADAKAGVFNVQIAADVTPGPHLVRLHNTDGASVLRVFMVGEQAEIVEGDANDEISKPQIISGLPVTINAQLEKSGDVDAYGIKLETGQCLVASLQGRRLGSAMDPMLHLYDDAGNEVAFTHDGMGLDPLLTYRAARAGNYVVRVTGFGHPPEANVRLAGGKNHFYRLSLTTGPFVRAVYPAGVKRGGKRELQLLGWNLEGQSVREADASRARQDYMWLSTGDSEGRMRIEVGDGPELTEEEASAAGAPLSAPFGVTGRLAAGGEQDRYRITMKKDQKVMLAVRAGVLGSPVDAVLHVEDEAGKSLARDDDANGSGDPRMEWTAPADGEYRVVVSDLNRQGSAASVYHLSAKLPVPQVRAAVAGHAVTVNAGKAASVKVNVARLHGYNGGLVVVATDLHTGVTCTSAEVPKAGGDVDLTFAAAPDAKAKSGAIRVMVLGTEVENPLAVMANYDLAKEGGQDLVAASEAIWLTVIPAPPAATQPATRPATQPAKSEKPAGS